MFENTVEIADGIEATGVRDLCNGTVSITELFDRRGYSYGIEILGKGHSEKIAKEL